MRRYISLIISVIFQPLVVPTLVFGLALFAVPEATSIPHSFKGRVFYLVALSTLVIPMVTVFALKFTRVLKSIHMAELKDRAIPFTVTSIYYVLTVYFLHEKQELDPILWKVLAVITSAIIILTLVTYFWKMSAHMTGMGGLIAAVIVLGFKFPTFRPLYPLLGSIMLTGLVGSVRLYLESHKPIEIYVGLIFGFTLCFLGFSWIWV